MTQPHPQQIEMIPISRITVLNPRSRNKRQHREIVNNIEAIGLKGDGIARHEGERLHIPYVLPGERIRADLHAAERGRRVCREEGVAGEIGRAHV